MEGSLDLKSAGRVRFDCGSDSMDAAEQAQAAVDAFFVENGLGVDDIEDILDGES